MLHPRYDMKIDEFDLVQKINEGEFLRELLKKSDCKDDPQFEKHVSNSLGPCRNFRYMYLRNIHWGAFAVAAVLLALSDHIVYILTFLFVDPGCQKQGRTERLPFRVAVPVV